MKTVDEIVELFRIHKEKHNNNNNNNNTASQRKYFNKLKKEMLGAKIQIVDWLFGYTYSELAIKMKLKNHGSLTKNDNGNFGVILDIVKHPCFPEIFIYHINLDGTDILIEADGFKVV